MSYSIVDAKQAFNGSRSYYEKVKQKIELGEYDAKERKYLGKKRRVLIGFIDGFKEVEIRR